MNKIKHATNKYCKGQGLVEFALVMPLILLLTMGIIDFGRIFYIYSASSNAAREAVRLGATDPNNCAQVNQAAKSQLAFIPPADYTVQITYDSGLAVKYLACQASNTFSPGDRILVDVQADFSPLTPIMSSMFPSLSLHYTSARTIAYAGSGLPLPPSITPEATPADAPGAAPADAPPAAAPADAPPGSMPAPTASPSATAAPTTSPTGTSAPAASPTATPVSPTPSGTAPASPTSTPTPSAAVSPILECTIDRNNGTYTAYWGYQNDNSMTVNVPVGSDNNFSPAPQDRGQPTVFQLGRTAYWPNAVFSVDFNGDPLVWTLKVAGQTKTATASRDSAPCSQHVFIEKEWYDANANKSSTPPANLPISYTITAQSVLGVATCNYPAGSSTLSCTYTNRKIGSRAALDDNGLWAPVGTTYTVAETGLPAGWTGYTGVGSFTSNIGGYCVNGRGGYTQNCTHAVKNTPTSLVVTLVSGYPYKEFGNGNKDVYGKVYVTFASTPVSGVTVTFTRQGNTYTATTNASGYACIQLGKSQNSGETVSVVASKAGYQSGNTTGITASYGSGGCP